MRHKIFLVVGSFGVGKTTVCSAFPQHEVVDELKWRLTKFKNLFIYGQHIRGLDSLRDKKAVVADLEKNQHRNFLLHGTFYQYATDIMNFSQFHDFEVINLNVSFPTNIERLRGRSKHFNEEKTSIRIVKKHQEIARFLVKCEEAGVPIHHIDAEKSKEEVKQAVWRHVLKNLPK